MSYPEDDNCSEVSYISEYNEDQDQLEQETRLIQKEKALFNNQRLTMEVAFETVLNTTTSNQARILALEETVIKYTKHNQFLEELVLSMEEDFETISKTTDTNKTRISELEESVAVHTKHIEFLQEMLVSMEEDYKEKESELNKVIYNQVIENKKLKIMLEEMVPEKIQHLEDRINLLHEIIHCKDQVIQSLQIEKK